MKRCLAAALFVCLMSTGAAHAEPILYGAVLTGPAESPPNTSPGLGFSLLSYDPGLRTLQVLAGFTNLLAPTTVAHIHCCTDPPGTAAPATPVPTFPGFPAGVTSGVYDHTLDLSMASSFNPAFLAAAGGTPAAAELGLVQGLDLGTAYFNIHTTMFPAGEIRGFFTRVSPGAPIPEPTTLFLVGGAIGGLAAARRRRRPSQS